MCNEIGDRGKVMVPEAVPPERTLAPASAPAVKVTTVTTSAPALAVAPAVDPTPAPAPTPALAPMSAPTRPAHVAVTMPPTTDQSSSATTHSFEHSSARHAAPTPNLIEASTFVDLAERMHAKIDEKIEHLREQMKAEAIAEKEQMKAQATAEKEQLRRGLMPRAVVTNEQLATLGSRLETMHAAQLISDEILFVCPLLKHPLRLHPCGALWCIVVQLGLISV
eukprot:COSAG06_NODE_2352_length_7023_cov_2.994368_3_plen_223_part_00